jgi:hypothetical protein
MECRGVISTATAATGSWTSRDPFCYMMYVALEQYTGADVNGPSARTVYGLDTFMDYDAKVSSRSNR